MHYIISIAKQFSEFPTGRFYSDTDVSGQAFREKFLVPRLKAGDSLLIDLDDVEGFGSSFLDEAFGGLIRLEGFRLNELNKNIKFKSEEDPSLIVEINGYLSDAEARKNK